MGQVIDITTRSKKELPCNWNHWQIRWGNGDIGAVAETEGQAWLRFLVGVGKRFDGWRFMATVNCLKGDHGCRAVEVRATYE